MEAKEKWFNVYLTPNRPYYHAQAGEQVRLMQTRDYGFASACYDKTVGNYPGGIVTITEEIVRKTTYEPKKGGRYDST